MLQAMLDAAQLRPGERVLDVGTGTGVVAFQAAKQVGVNGTVVGIDLSDGMLAVARAQAERAGLSAHIEFRTMDAEALQLAEGSFDGVLSLFALLHFPNPLGALQQMLRVLRPGGRLIVAVGSGPPWLSLRGLGHRVRCFFELLLAIQGKRLFAPAFLNDLTEQYLPANGEAEETDLARTHHNRSNRVPALVHKAGFINVRSYW